MDPGLRRDDIGVGGVRWSGGLGQDVGREVGAGVEDFHADDVAGGVVIEDDAGRDFFAFFDRFGRKADVGGVGFWVVGDDGDHFGLAWRSKNADIIRRSVSVSTHATRRTRFSRSGRARKRR